MTQELNLFCCYAREDRALRNRLDIHLSTLKHQNLIRVWWDREILPGTDWKKEIDARLDEAQIILLLVSPFFMSSTYCYGFEMRKALERHYAGVARVVPIILRPVDWEDTPFSKLQVLPPGSVAVTLWPNRDEAFWRVTKEIRLVVKDLQGFQVNRNLLEEEIESIDNKREKTSHLLNDISLSDQSSLTLFNNITSELSLIPSNDNTPPHQPSSSDLVLLEPSVKVVTSGESLNELVTEEISKPPSVPSNEPSLTQSPFTDSRSSVYTVDSPYPTKSTSVEHKECIARHSRGRIISLVGLAFIMMSSSLLYTLKVINEYMILPAMTSSAVPTYVPINNFMFGFDPAHTHWNSYEKVLSVTNVSHLRPDWMYLTGRLGSSPSVSNNVVYVGSNNGRFYAFNALCRSDCVPFWVYKTDGIIDSSPAVTNGVIFIGSWNHKFYAFSAFCRRDCQPLWTYTTGGIIVSSPTVANGVIYIGSEDGKFYAFDALCRSSCQPLWSYEIGDSIDSSPAVANGMIYIGADKLYAFGLTK